MLAGQLGWAGAPGGAEQDRGPASLARLSLDELLDVEVVTATKHKEKIGDLPAAVFVITADDLRRAGVTTVADALRMVPGVEVARADTDVWAVSIRGFNSAMANKLLVLVDGRTVCSPLFSGTQWQDLDLLREDIERIEVVRGPGGAVWGANAVNGVINIITRRAQVTQGTLLTTTVGTQERSAGARYGGKLGPDAYYRIYTKATARDAISSMSGERQPSDHGRLASSGLQLDWEPSEDDQVALDAGYYYNRVDTELIRVSLDPPDTSWMDGRNEAHGAFVKGEWKRLLSERADWRNWVYYDHHYEDRKNSLAQWDTLDLDSVYHAQWGERHKLTGGGGARMIWDKLYTNVDTWVTSESDANQLVQLFAQDEITLVAERLWITPGVKLEHSSLSGSDVLPSLRLLGKPSPKQSVWAGVSRAVHTPSRFDRDVSLVQVTRAQGDQPAGVTVISGNPNVESESVVAYEAGYRVQLTDRLWLDNAAFFNDYRDLQTWEVSRGGEDAQPSYLYEVPTNLASEGVTMGEIQRNANAKGHTYGGETAARWRATEAWELNLAYSFLHADMELTRDVLSTSAAFYEGSSPRHQVSVRSAYNITRQLDFDVHFRFVDELPDRKTDRYCAADLRLAYRPRPHWEWSLEGRDLWFDGAHVEFETYEVDPSYLAILTVQF